MSYLRWLARTRRHPSAFLLLVQLAGMLLYPFVEHTDDMFRQVDAKMLGLGLAKPGEYVVVVAGTPANAPGSTNTLRVHQLGSLAGPANA